MVLKGSVLELRYHFRLLVAAKSHNFLFRWNKSDVSSDVLMLPSAVSYQSRPENVVNISFAALCLRAVSAPGHRRSGGGETEACGGHSRGRRCHLHPGEGEGAITPTGDENALCKVVVGRQRDLSQLFDCLLFVCSWTLSAARSVGWKKNSDG